MPLTSCSVARAVRSCVLGLALMTAAAVSAPRNAHAEPAKRTWNFLTTGNGHGFQVFDHNKHRIVQFLEHPYRYLRPQPNREPPGERQGDGVGRRNLAYDVFFGVKGPGGAGWLTDDTTGELPEYVEQTNIIRAPGTVSGIRAESFYFAPFGLERNVMVGLLHAPGATDGYALLNFHMGGGRTEPDAKGESSRSVSAVPKALIERGPGGGAMVYVPIGTIDHAGCESVFEKGKSGQDLTDKAECTGDDLTTGFQKKLGADGWMGFAASYVDNESDAEAAAVATAAWAGTRSPEVVLSDAKKEWDAWRKPPPEGTALCSEDEKKLWRQGEAVLRMGQVRETNRSDRKNRGMILASLPPGEWHTGWVRDATYGVVALIRSGHFEEARMALDFYLDAFEVNPASISTGPNKTINGKQGKYQNYVRDKPYRISVTRYFGTGEEEGDWNVDGPNVETDGWGLVLWAARLYVELSGDVKWLDRVTFDGTVWEALTKGIASPIEANLEPNGIMAADSSIWETHEGKKRHFAYTTLAAARGLCDMAGIAKKAGKDVNIVTNYQALAKRLREGFLSSFIDPQGALAGSIEGLSNGKYTDGAVAEAFAWNILQDWKGDTAKATLSLLDKLKVESGGYKRNDDGLSSYDNNEWILVDLRIANANRRAGKVGEADRIVADVTSKAAANFYLIPELFNDTPQAGEVGIYTGSIPMVGYGGGAYIITMLDRSGISEPNDCGDGKSAGLVKLDCGGVVTTPGGGGAAAGGGPATGANGSAADVSTIPYRGACLCGLGPDRGIQPLGLAVFLAAPAFFVARRARRRFIGRKLRLR